MHCLTWLSKWKQVTASWRKPVRPDAEGFDSRAMLYESSISIVLTKKALLRYGTKCRVTIRFSDIKYQVVLRIKHHLASACVEGGKYL